jgi:4-diphosphocytidyl-2-C-methyl-D-erythritol kinase
MNKRPLPDLWPAPAKVNLFLHVIGRQADGYHRLQTVFRLIDWSDTLRFVPRADGALRRCYDVAGIAPDQDLCLRAAQLLRRHCPDQCSTGFDVYLDKRLPIGGGLGGGSSDAATCLVALNFLWGCSLSRAALARLGLALGADVPFFIFGHNAFGQGVGEQLKAVALAPAWYVITLPPVQVPTGEIFVDPDLPRDTPPIAPDQWFPGFGRNDLEAVSSRRYPVVAQHLAWLREQIPGARMSGSGACCLAECASPELAQSVWARRPSAMNARVVQGLDEHPLNALW